MTNPKDAASIFEPLRRQAKKLFKSSLEGADVFTASSASDGVKAKAHNTSLQKRKGRSIQSRLILLLLVILLPILGIQGFLHHQMFQHRRAQELQTNMEVARDVGRAFDAFVKDVLHTELLRLVLLLLAIPLCSQTACKDCLKPVRIATRLSGTSTGSVPTGVFLHQATQMLSASMCRTGPTL